MKRFMNSKWFYLILSLFFALLLYFNANNTGSNVQSFESNDKTSSYQERLTNVPITFKYDEKKYYITSDVTKADVQLTSSNKVILDMESNPKTRNFQLIADLRGYGPGTYDISLKTGRLNNAASAKIEPKTIKVTVSERVDRNFDIQTNVNDNWIATGYQLKKVSVSPQKVTVSASNQTMNQIHQIVAIVPEKKDLTESFTTSVPLKAVDVNGNELNVTFSTNEVSVTVDVDSSSKEVPVNLMQTGTPPNGVSSYHLLCDTQTVTLHGSKSDLDKIKGIDVPIDISDIDKTESKEFTLDIPKSVKSNINKVSVTIIPKTGKDDVSNDEGSSSSTTTEMTGRSSSQTMTTDE